MGEVNLSIQLSINQVLTKNAFPRSGNPMMTQIYSIMFYEPSSVSVLWWGLTKQIVDINTLAPKKILLTWGQWPHPGAKLSTDFLKVLCKWMKWILNFKMYLSNIKSLLQFDSNTVPLCQALCRSKWAGGSNRSGLKNVLLSMSRIFFEVLLSKSIGHCQEYSLRFSSVFTFLGRGYWN